MARVAFSILCLFLFCLCIALGIWQLHRYAYKKALLTTHQSITVRGHYLNALTVLVQNRFYHDELGFEVLTPLQLSHDKKLLLIDRGWIKKPNNGSLPDIHNVTTEQEIKGHVKLLNEYQFILGENILEPEKKPLVVQRVDVNELSQVTHQLFYPFSVQLNADQQNGYVRDWTIVTVPPSRHMMYAIQWFAFAVILLIGYFCYVKSGKNENKR